MTDAAVALSIPSEAKRSISNFWICCYPFFESTLFIVPPLLAQVAPEEGSSEQAAEAETVEKTPLNQSTRLRAYDPDGELINEIELGFTPGSVGLLELGPFLGSCKIEAGLKHAHLVVESPPGYAHYCRIHGEQGGAMLGTPVELGADNSVFFPVSIGEDRCSVLCIINKGEEEARVQCRLYRGNRSPKFSCTIPPFGCRVFGVESEFSEYSDSDEPAQTQAYLRLSVVGHHSIGVQVVERIEGAQQKGLYTSVT